MSAFRERLGKELPRDIAESLFTVKKCRPMATRIAVDRWLWNRKKGFAGLEHPEKFIVQELFSRGEYSEYLYYDPDSMTWDEQEALREGFRQEDEWRDVERQIATGQLDEVDTPMTQAKFDAAVAAGEAMF